MSETKYKINRVFRMLVNSILFFFVRFLNIKANISKELQDIDEPYLLLGNHIGTYDPFFVSYFINKPAHFVSADAVFRDPLIGFLFKKLGVIPKKKNTRDTRVIRDMVGVARAGGAIGLFPEGTRTWTGASLPFDPSIAKLVKLLNIPVITVKIQGLQLSNPRWGLKLRRSTVELDYQLAFSKEQLRSATLTDILAKITQQITHDEVDYQREKMHLIRSKYKAEYIEHVLFLCHACRSTGKIVSKGNDFECLACHQKTHINVYGFFELLKGKKLLFDNIRDTYEWQRIQFESFIEKEFSLKTQTSLFSDKNVLIYQEKMEKMVLLGKASLYFFIDHILIDFENGQQSQFSLDDISMLNPQFHEKIEVTHLNENYRFVGETLKISGLKWEIACSTIWNLRGQTSKISTYLK